MRSWRMVLHATVLLAVLGISLSTAPVHAQTAYTPDDVLAAIATAADEIGVSEPWLRHVVSCETGGTFNPYAVGDHGTSYGAAQLHRGGGELPRFYAMGYSDPFDPYSAMEFMAYEFADGRASAWTCAR